MARGRGWPAATVSPRLTGQDLTHPTQEPCEGGDGLDDHDAHEDEKMTVLVAPTAKPPEMIWNPGEERSRGQAGDSGRGYRSTHARTGYFFMRPWILAAYGFLKRAEGAGDEEEQGLVNAWLKMLDGAVERHLASGTRREAQAEEHV